jgi:glucose/arabinose dehydrogenase
MGLLGMAFHPGFPAMDPRVFVHYTNTTSGRVSRISEFRSLNGGQTLDPNSERILLVIRQPESNHNGGHLAFGPDGYLYIGMGDGGGANDMHGAIGNGQLMTTLLGKMLRIDVNGAQPYAIPAGNPFAGFAPCGPNA